MAPDLIAPSLGAYLEDLIPTRTAELERMEAYAGQNGFPIIGPVAGHLCYQVARMTGAQRVFELGSGYGYSTAWFARAVQENGGGTVHHVVWDADLSAKARTHLSAMGYDDIVHYHVGEAVEALRDAPGVYDIIFNDIDKEGYPASLAVINEKLKPGGILIIDNMLWGGRIFEDADQSPATQGVREVTRMLTADQGWIASLVPVRDGLIIAMKK